MLGVFGRRSNVVGTLLLDLRDWLFSFSNPLSCFTNCNSRGLLVFFSFEINSRNRKPVFCERIRRVRRIGGEVLRRGDEHKNPPAWRSNLPTNNRRLSPPREKFEGYCFVFYFFYAAVSLLDRKTATNNKHN